MSAPDDRHGKPSKRGARTPRKALARRRQRRPHRREVL